MHPQIIRSKVRQPVKRRETLRRARLIDKLHQNIHRKLTYISAPAGYGKTSLLVDFASDIDAKVCWYHITPGDDDLYQFGFYLVKAFQEQFQDFGKNLEGFFLAPNQSLEPQSLGIEIINEIIASINDFCVIILDDYHTIGESQPVVDLIETLLDHLPDQVRLVIASRNIYGVPTAKLYVRREINTVSADDLRFRADEIQALVRQNFRFKLSVDQAMELAKRSDGWIVAIMLGMNKITQGVMPRFDGSTAEQVYNFLAEEVIQKEKPALRSFMLDTSVLDEFDVSLSSYLLEIPSSEELIQELEKRNLFVTSVETNNGTSFRFHQLFLEFLRDRLSKTDPDRKKQLHRRAAGWFHEKELWEEAVRQKLAAGDRQEAASWMNLAAKHIFVAGKTHVLTHWIETLASTPDIRNLAPQLLLFQAKALIDQGNHDAGEQLLDISQPIFQDHNDLDQLVNAMITRAIIRQNQRRFQEALDIIDAAKKILSSNDHLSKFRWHQTDRIKGFCLGQTGKPGRAIEHLQNAIAGFQNLLNDVDERVIHSHIAHDLGVTLTDLGIIHFENGHMLEAQDCMQQALELQRKTRTNLALIAASLNNIGYLYSQTGQYQAAWEIYQEAQETLKNLDRSRFHIYLNNSIGDIQRDLNEWGLAEQAYRKAIEKGKKYNAEILLYASYAGLADLDRLRGKYSKAFNWLREAAKVRKLKSENPLYQVKLGEIYLDMGQVDLAIQAFEQAQSQWEILKRARQEKVRSAFLLGRALFEKKQPEKALGLFKEALQGAAQLGYDQFLVIEGRRARPFLEYAAQNMPASHQIQGLIERVDSFQTGLSQFIKESDAIPGANIHLEIRAFGPSQVWVNGQLLQKSAWKSTKARALFFYVLEQRKARSTDIKMEFWPEFNSSRANSNLQATLWRTRNAVGGKHILVNQNDQYLLSPHITVWYDVAEFRNYMALASDINISQHERVEFWRRAIALYKGDFLDDIYMDWSDDLRNELRDLFLETMIHLANWEVSRHHYANARALYEKVIATDPYRDDIHLSIMRCQLQSGSPSAAQTHFKKYKTFLQDEGLTPSPELETFYEELTGA